LEPLNPYSIPTLQHCSIPTLQHCSIAALLPYSIQNTVKNESGTEAIKKEESYKRIKH
jgi:hypothetical protein